MKILWQGKEYPYAAKMNGGEIMFVERKLGGLDVADWTRTMGAYAMVYASVSRLDPGAITWEALTEVDTDALDGLLVDDGENPAGAEPEEGADPLGGGSPASSGSRGSRGGAPKVAARKRSGARSTSSTSRTTSGSRPKTSTP